MRNELLNQLSISPHQLKVFIGTFLAMFVMMLLQNLGVPSPFKRVPHAAIPVEKKTEIPEPVRHKLEEKKNTFQLKKESKQLVPVAHAEEPHASDQAAAYALVDLDTGKILASKNGDQAMPIASITKIMTAVVALDLASPSEVFTVTQRAASEPPTKIVILPGERITLEELLNASLLTSANDATEQIREGIDTKYQKEIFVQAMNKKAEFLGLNHTHFGNPQGFDYGDNHSSPEDVAVLAQYALNKYPLIADIVKKNFQQFPADANHQKFDLYNWNGLIGVYPDTKGVKIGNTDAAGYTTSVVSTRNGKTLAAVVLGAPGVLERDLWAAELLDVGYQKTLGLAPVGVTEDQLREKYGTWEYGN